MLKTILAQVRQYKLASILSMVFAAAEVVMEVILPLLTAAIIDKGTISSAFSNAMSVPLSLF